MEQLDKDTFVMWMERFDQQESVKTEEASIRPMIDGIPLLDNQDGCQMLHVNKRTLQRYRASNALPFEIMLNKAWYRESDVLEFMKLHFNDNFMRKRELKSKSKK